MGAGRSVAHGNGFSMVVLMLWNPDCINDLPAEMLLLPIKLESWPLFGSACSSTNVHFHIRGRQQCVEAGAVVNLCDARSSMHSEDMHAEDGPIVDRKSASLVPMQNNCFEECAC